MAPRRRCGLGRSKRWRRGRGDRSHLPADHSRWLPWPRCRTDRSRWQRCAARREPSAGRAPRRRRAARSANALLFSVSLRDPWTPGEDVVDLSFERLSRDVGLDAPSFVLCVGCSWLIAILGGLELRRRLRFRLGLAGARSLVSRSSGNAAISTSSGDSPGAHVYGFLVSGWIDPTKTTCPPSPRTSMPSARDFTELPMGMSAGAWK